MNRRPNTVSAAAEALAGDGSRPAPDPSRSILAWLILGNLLVVLLVAALSAVSLHASRTTFTQRALDATDSLTRSLQQGIAAEIGRIDVALQAAAQAYRRAVADAKVDPLLRDAPAPVLAPLLVELQSLMPGVESLCVVDESGVVRFGHGPVHEAGVSGSDHDYFVQARDGPDGRLIVSEAMWGGVDRKWVIVLARRLSRPDGSFAGIVLASLAAERFQQQFAAVKLGRQDAIALRMASLRLVARHTGVGLSMGGIGSTDVSPQLRDALQARPDGGTFIARAALDGIERASAYRRVGGYPLVVLVGLATDDYLAPWRTEVVQVTALALLGALGLMGSSVFGYRAWQRQATTGRALIREGQRHRALMLTSSDGIHVLDRSGRLVELNDAFAAMLGRERESMLGMHMLQWDARYGAAGIEQMLREFGVGRRFEVATRFRRRDGSLIEVDVVGTGLCIERRELLYCAARDVTQRKRAEQALRASEAFLDRTGRIAGVGGWELDLGDDTLDWSDQTCRIHEVAPGYRPTLDEAIQFYAPASRGAILGAVQAAVQNGSPWDLELPLITRGGRLIWVHVVGEVASEAGKPGRLIGAIQDVTERRQREAELAREQAERTQAELHAQQLDALLHERDQMLDVLAHEVRQPLNNASAALQSAAKALEELGEEVASQRLTRAQTVMAQVLASIDNTLAVASLLARPDLIERGDTDVDTVVALAIADMPAADRGRIRVERGTSTRTASMDMSLMRIALRNLLSNALKYSPADSPVCVTLSDSDDPLALVIDVADTGAGVAAAVLPRLFERGSSGRRAGGAAAAHGLGLYIVRRVMELHGGQVSLVRNGPGGATMRLVIEQAPED